VTPVRRKRTGPKRNSVAPGRKKAGQPHPALTRTAGTPARASGYRDVGCAVIAKGEYLLIAQRRFGERMAGYWEFPGGKRRSGETLCECLIREVREELGVTIRPRFLLRRARVESGGRKFRLCFCLCQWVAGYPQRRECQDFRWVRPEELMRYRFPPGDLAVMADLILKKNYYRDLLSTGRHPDDLAAGATPRPRGG